MTRPVISALLVGIGGFAGSVARYGLSVASQRLSFEWPVGTLTANVAGCFAIGVIAALAARGGAISPEARLLLAAGFCGGLTTMSSMVYETAEMIRASEYLHAAAYAAGSYAASMAAFFAGLAAVRTLIQSGGELWN